MDLFLHNLPPQATENDLDRFFKEILQPYGIQVFRCKPLRKAGCATLTLLRQEDGSRILRTFEAGIKYQSRTIFCQRSRKEPDEFELKAMLKTWNDNLKPKRGKTTPATSQARDFAVQTLACGLWDYQEDELVFLSYFEDDKKGFLRFGKYSLELYLESELSSTTVNPQLRLDISYSTIQSITSGSKQHPSLTMSLTEAPRMYASNEGAHGVTRASTASINQLLEKLQLANESSASFWKADVGTKQEKWKRLCHLGKNHHQVVATCLVYRVLLKDSRDLQRISALERDTVPPISRWPSRAIKPTAPFHAEQSTLNQKLALTYASFPFGLKFQLQELNQNGCLPPSKVLALLPDVRRLVRRCGADIATQVVKKLTTQIPFPGPGTPAEDLDYDGLLNLLKVSENLISETASAVVRKDNERLCLVYKAIVTPAGIYLYGPDYEVGNRVLRQYSRSASQFLRVSFLDENVEPVRFDPDASNEEVFARFKSKLAGVINIAGQGFEFLGYSHSSLRSQTCWYMAPYTHNGSLLHARILIAKLGDFSAIRSPAKCAARIGQAFSDTTAAIPIPKKAVQMIPDIERSGRVFSDGVGTMSKSIIERIMAEYPTLSSIVPTAFQIRFRGAKGMISYDSRLKGEVLCLRPSMVKFEGSPANDIEICGMASGPLPFYLNRQLIKILEDLGVPQQSFQCLQDNAVRILRKSTSSGLNAARFFRRVAMGGGAKLPSLLTALHSMGLSFQADDFLRDVVELGVLMALRDIKHKSRILVPDGVTVYGVVDTTGYLQEGEIYCSVKEQGAENRVLRGRIACTRSPALHPGDVQLVKGVSVPQGSPLADLYNVVVFSSQGSRDMASQLSGGDLDGDLFHLIFDKDLHPRKIVRPADYPRVPPLDIGRQVEVTDMAQFFLEFMQNDQLGRIAVLHQVLADQAPKGTLDHDCLKLADMHSTAVDFSKTGRAVDMSQLPRHNRFRPDFLAPGPQIHITKGISVEDDDELPSLGPKSGYKYYESSKTLGHLYRSIDEQEFFRELQNASKRYQQASSSSLLQQVWLRLRKYAPKIDWKPYMAWAQNVKESYESNLLDNMSDYSTNFARPLDELEAFLGTIVGMRSVPTKRQKEASVELRDKMERDIAFTTAWIADGPGDEEVDHLGQAMACMSLSLNPRDGTGLRSFAWLAAGICLREVGKLPG